MKGNERDEMNAVKDYSEFDETHFVDWEVGDVNSSSR